MEAQQYRRMDPEARSRASLSSNQNLPARTRRRPYLIVTVLLGLAFVACYFQLRARDQEVSVLPFPEELGPCHADDPVRRVAVIGIDTIS